MHLILGIIIGFLAMLQFGLSSALLGAAVGALIAEVAALRRRLGVLEKKSSGREQQVKAIDQEVVFTPVSAPNPTAKARTDTLRPISNQAAARAASSAQVAALDMQQPPSAIDRLFNFRWQDLFPIGLENQRLFQYR